MFVMIFGQWLSMKFQRLKKITLNFKQVLPVHVMYNAYIEMKLFKQNQPQVNNRLSLYMCIVP